MREGWLRTAVASLVICATAGALLWRGTNGFRALTTEQARRSAIAAAPRAVPEVALEDQDGRPFSLAEYRGRPVVVDFVYTQCRTVCPMLSASFQRIARTRAPGTDVALLSISFDPSDSVATLRDYAGRYRADARDWRFARVRDTTELPGLLRAFGIVVIPDGRGDFQHNAAIHVVNPEGRLARVMDLDASPESVLRVARAR